MIGARKKDDHCYFSIDLEATANTIIRKKINIDIRKEKAKLLYAADTIIHKTRELLEKLLETIKE